jgi:outer membrane protein assembly factor BamA
MEIEANVMSKVLGSEHSFNEYILDIRNYFSIGKFSILAVQGYMKLMYGEVPFQRAARFGGGIRGRGYFEGRFIDNHMYSIQAEYRLKLGKRWKVAGFIVTGEVADRPTNFLSDLKRAAGGGIRWQPLKGNESSLRLDIAINKDQNLGFYFGINEAF